MIQGTRTEVRDMVEIREMRELGRERKTDHCEQRREEVCMEQRKSRRGYFKNEMFIKVWDLRNVLLD